MSGIDFQVIDQKIYALDDQISFEEAQKRAGDRSQGAFGMISKFLSRPEGGDITLVYSEKRYEPFWYVLCTTHLEYNRMREIGFEVDDVVRSVTINGVAHGTPRGSKKMAIEGVEYCVEDLKKEIFLDADSGKGEKGFQKYVGFKKHEIRETEELSAGETIIVPAKVKASYLVRNFLSQMLKPVKADDILAEQIRIEKLYLFFRPIYAFEYQWKSKGKYAILEIDGLTLDVKSGGKAIKLKLKEAIIEADLFDLGADAVGLFVPGGSFALKAAKKGVELLHKKK